MADIVMVGRLCIVRKLPKKKKKKLPLDGGKAWEREINSRAQVVGSCNEIDEHETRGMLAMVLAEWLASARRWHGRDGACLSTTVLAALSEEQVDNNGDDDADVK